MNNRIRNEVKQFITDDSINANIFVTFANNQPGTVGIAWASTTCSKDISFKAAIVEHYQSDASAGQVRPFIFVHPFYVNIL
jgi:hypothetical protein